MHKQQEIKVAAHFRAALADAFHAVVRRGEEVSSAPIGNGRTIVFAHGLPDGSVSEKAIHRVLETDGFLVVCHPSRVAKAHPEIAHRVVGHWDGTTGIRWSSDGDLVVFQRRTLAEAYKLLRQRANEEEA